MGMLLLTVSGGLIALGFAQIVQIYRERRAQLLRSELRSQQMVMAARQTYRIGSHCHVCSGSRLVDDGQIDCYPDGSPFLCGPIKRVKDCPACSGGAQ